ncbi:MAG: carboxylesterase family protein, partial [Planctomycetota bacterium]
MHKRPLFTSVLVLLLLLLPSRIRAAEEFPKRVDMKDFSTHYYLDVPKQYFEKENAEKKWPLLVGLHGAGDTAKNYITGFWNLRDRGYIILAVKSPGRAWSGGEEKLVFASMEDVKKAYRIDAKRISVMGFSSGAFFGMPLVFKHPKVFQALVAMGGGGSVAVKKEARALHVYLLSGELDPIKGTLEAAYKALRKKKLDVTLRIVPGIGHVWPPEKELETIWNWFHKFSPEGIEEVKLEKMLEKAREGLKKTSPAKAVKLLMEISKSPVKCKAVEEAKKELTHLGLKVKEEIEKA